MRPPQAPPQSDNNQMSATPFDIVVAPDPTHYMYLEVVFDAAPGNFIGTPAALAGVNVATVNGIFGNFSSEYCGAAFCMSLVSWYSI